MNEFVTFTIYTIVYLFVEIIVTSCDLNSIHLFVIYLILFLLYNVNILIEEICRFSE